MNHRKYLMRSFELAIQGMQRAEGGPFGALIVKEDEIIAEANNQVLLLNDPTAHAEVQAIRQACKKLGSFQLDNCILYTSCEPCPMCLGAIYWARPSEVYFGATKETASSGGFDDAFIYLEIPIEPPLRTIPFCSLKDLSEEAKKPFEIWNSKQDKTLY